MTGVFANPSLKLLKNCFGSAFPEGWSFVVPTEQFSSLEAAHASGLSDSCACTKRFIPLSLFCQTWASPDQPEVS